MPLFSSTTVEISDSARYMKQLCRHFGHKVDATFDDESARVEFPDAPATFKVLSPTELFMEVSGADTETVERFQDVVQRHLEKFAFREELVFAWQTPASKTSA